MNRPAPLSHSRPLVERRAMMARDAVIARIVAVHDLLISESDISPRNRKIAPALRCLVETLMKSYEPSEAAAILNHAIVSSLRASLLDRLSEAESELEMFWAHRFLDRRTLNLVDLEEFLYWRHYERLLATELQALARTRWKLNAHQGASIVFVGGGALPLSAIVIHMLTGEPVVCLDENADAVDCAKLLLAKLGLSQVAAVKADGAAFDYGDASVVFIASLVNRKTRVAQRVAETGREPVVAVRSVEGVRALLYSPADLGALKSAGLCLVAQTKPHAETINNTLFFNICPLTGSRAGQCGP